MKVLVLDFDGVIADSKMECLFVGFNSYLNFNKNTKLFDGKGLTFDNFEYMVRKYKKIASQYKKLRPYVIDAFCYYVVSHIIENSIKINNWMEYNKTRKKLMKAFYDEYVKSFYNERKKLIKEDFEKWLDLEKPYKSIVSILKRFTNDFLIAIATNNKAFTVKPFLKKYGIRVKIITDASLSSDKEVHIQHIKDKLNANYKDMYFVDDQINNFLKLLPLGVHCYLAKWGYNTKEQQEEAKRQGVILIDKDTFYKTIKDDAKNP